MKTCVVQGLRLFRNTGCNLESINLKYHWRLEIISAQKIKALCVELWTVRLSGVAKGKFNLMNFVAAKITNLVVSLEATTFHLNDAFFLS